MPDRVVYLVSAMPKKSASSSLEFVDDEELGILLSQGWEVSTTIPDRLVKVAGKSVKATMMVLKSAGENRGLVMRDEPTRARRAGGTMVTVTDDFGGRQQMEPGHALVRVIDKMERALLNMGDPGHLGGARNHNMPGLQIVSGEIVQKAFDVGLMAARRGESEDANPWPGTEAGQNWLKGFRLGQRDAPQKADPIAAEEAYQVGLRTTKDFGPNDVVTCPYPPSSPLREHWIRGFRDGGGRVEQ